MMLRLKMWSPWMCWSMLSRNSTVHSPPSVCSEMSTTVSSTRHLTRLTSALMTWTSRTRKGPRFRVASASRAAARRSVQVACMEGPAAWKSDRSMSPSGR